MSKSLDSIDTLEKAKAEIKRLTSQLGMLSKQASAVNRSYEADIIASLRFPTTDKKAWSSHEVQEWLNQQVVIRSPQKRTVQRRETDVIVNNTSLLGRHYESAIQLYLTIKEDKSKFFLFYKNKLPKPITKLKLGNGCIWVANDHIKTLVGIYPDGTSKKGGDVYVKYVPRGVIEKNNADS